jgi:hypothetical protein
MRIAKRDLRSANTITQKRIENSIHSVLQVLGLGCDRPLFWKETRVFGKVQPLLRKSEISGNSGIMN